MNLQVALVDWPWELLVSRLSSIAGHYYPESPSWFGTEKSEGAFFLTWTVLKDPWRPFSGFACLLELGKWWLVTKDRAFAVDALWLWDCLLKNKCLSGATCLVLGEEFYSALFFQAFNESGKVFLQFLLEFFPLVLSHRFGWQLCCF